MARHQSSQPTYDFLTGGEQQQQQQAHNSQSLTHSVRRAPSTTALATGKADLTNEPLRAQLHSLQYELDALKQEHNLAQESSASQLREAHARAESEISRSLAADKARQLAAEKASVAAREAQDLRTAAANEKVALEKKVRAALDERDAARDELLELQGDVAGRERAAEFERAELERRVGELEGLESGWKSDLQSKVDALQSALRKLGDREVEVGELEKEVLRLKAQTGDVETLAIIKKELAEQVAYIQRLEVTNRELSAEVTGFRKAAKKIEVVEEEKRALEARLRMMDDLRRELSEAQLQKRILEDERRGWASYLEDEARAEEDMKFDTPEQMARAFLQERVERANLLDKLGTLQPEMLVRDAQIQGLQEDKTRIMAELEEARKSTGAIAAAPAATTSAGDSRARARLERQRHLMAKEVEYLKAQMRTFEEEEAEFNPESSNDERTKRVTALEAMVEQYRQEVQGLHDELSKVETPAASTAAVTASPKKRSREEEDEAAERLGEMRRKSRALQEDLDALQTRNQILEAELKASLSQVESLKESSRTRTLEFRDNPTAKVEAIKMTTLKTLREENEALLQQLQGRPVSSKVVPISTLDNIRLQLDEAHAQMAQTDKKTSRLKQIWGSKSLEFREAVCSILGWKLDFMPNGRVKATSILYPSLMNDGEEEENSIVFDGEKGTMKISGGPQSMFAHELKGLIEFWVEGRKEIPCFLAACTLEFYDRTTRAGRM